MSTQTLKDAHYRIIGYIETRSDGVQVIKNAHYHTLGYFDPKYNQTRNEHYQIVGQGNLLTSLLQVF